MILRNFLMAGNCSDVNFEYMQFYSRYTFSFIMIPVKPVEIGILLGIQAISHISEENMVRHENKITVMVCGALCDYDYLSSSTDVSF